jgi:phage tail sheath protein FI
MFAYRAPGVYFEQLDSGPPAIGLSRTDIAGFVGIASRGRLHRPVKIESMTQFNSVFGSAAPNAYLAYAVEGFFTNAGETCWVVRVANPATAKSAALDLLAPNGDVSLTLKATSEGVWADNMAVSIIRTGDDRFTLTLRLSDGTQEVWRNLSMAAPSIDLRDSSEAPTLRLALSNPDDWTAQASVRLRPAAGGRFALEVQLSNGKQGSWDKLTMNPKDKNYAPAVLNGKAGTQLVRARDLKSPSADHAPDVAAGNLINGTGLFAIDPRFAGLVLNDLLQGSQLVQVSSLGDAAAFPENTPAPRLPKLVAFDAREGHGTSGADGLTFLSPDHFTGESGAPGGPWGLAALSTIDEISMVAIPDIMPKPVVVPRFQTLPSRCDVLDAEPDNNLPPATPMEFPPVFDSAEISGLQQALVRHCEELKNRVAILDARHEDITPPQVLAWRNQFDTSFAGLYWPWLSVNDPLQLEGLLREIPPSGHVAGIFARNDLRIGVHKAPANEIVEGAKDLTAPIGDVQHGDLNSRGVNVIRSISGRGLRTMGARTLSSDESLRYINVRRLLLMIEESIDRSCQWTAFEPNNPDLWRQIARVARSFLDTLWRRNMLDGASASDAYFVKCDETTNPESETDNGRLNCLIGVQPPWPAEFVIVRIGKTESSTEIQETTGGRNG